MLVRANIESLSMFSVQAVDRLDHAGFVSCKMRENLAMHAPVPMIAVGVTASTALTDAVYVLFNSAVTARRRVSAANWSSLWYMLSAFAVISYTGNPIYALFASAGSWIGAYVAVSWLKSSS